MKTLRHALLAASLMIAASAPAPAQLMPAPDWIEFVTGENISFSEATWELFTMVASATSKDPGTFVEEIPGRLRLDDKRHRALFAHMKSAVADSDKFATSLRSDMCRQRADFSNIERVAGELELIDEKIADHRDKLMAAAGPILGLEATARLEAVVMEVRDNMKLPRIDYAGAMRARKETVPAVMTRLCAEFDTRR